MGLIGMRAMNPDHDDESAPRDPVLDAMLTMANTEIFNNHPKNAEVDVIIAISAEDPPIINDYRVFRVSRPDDNDPGFIDSHITDFVGMGEEMVAFGRLYGPRFVWLHKHPDGVGPSERDATLSQMAANLDMLANPLGDRTRHYMCFVVTQRDVSASMVNTPTMILPIGHDDLDARVAQRMVDQLVFELGADHPYAQAAIQAHQLVEESQAASERGDISRAMEILLHDLPAVTATMRAIQPPDGQPPTDKPTSPQALKSLDGLTGFDASNIQYLN